MRKYTIDDAKWLITDFCEEEYGTENVDFSNLECIGIAYTTTEDERFEIQTNIDLIHNTIDYWLYDKCIKTEKYFSTTDLCVRALNCLAFDWLVEPQMSYYDTVYGYDDWHMSMSNR